MDIKMSDSNSGHTHMYIRPEDRIIVKFITYTGRKETLKNETYTCAVGGW